MNSEEIREHVVSRIAELNAGRQSMADQMNLSTGAIKILQLLLDKIDGKPEAE